MRTTMIPMTVDTFETRRRYIGPTVTRKPHACADTFEALGGVAGRGVGRARGVGGRGVEGGLDMMGVGVGNAERRRMQGDPNIGPWFRGLGFRLQNAMIIIIRTPKFRNAPFAPDLHIPALFMVAVLPRAF